MTENKQTGTDNLFERTRRLEDQAGGRRDRFRPAFHLSPPTGWMNDPNGLCQIKGRYHVFFQYTPSDAGGDGFRGWGHYSSKDLLTWRYEGLSLAPDTPWDKDGAYSGSALVEDGRVLFYYTGNVKEPGDHDYILSGRGANVLLVESPDAFRMGGKQLLLTNEDYPSDCSCHVRDPKVFKEKEGGYCMVLGARTREDRGEVLVYGSEDGYHFRLLNRLHTWERFGYMWECPDLFTLKGQTFLSVSPQGLPAEDFRYQNVYQSGWFPVRGDYRGAYELGGFTEWDKGFDFYAPQTFVDEKGRRILYGWAGVPDAEYGNPTVERGWQHCLTAPREVTLKDGKLLQYPVEELKELRTKESRLPSGCMTTAGSAFELEVEGKAEGSSLGEIKITVAEGLVFRYDGKEEIRLEFTSDIGAGRRLRRAHLSDVRQLRLMVDASLLEIYVNHGEMVFTTRFYPRMYTLTVEAEDTVQTLWSL